MDEIMRRERFSGAKGRKKNKKKNIALRVVSRSRGFQRNSQEARERGMLKSYRGARGGEEGLLRRPRAKKTNREKRGLRRVTKTRKQKSAGDGFWAIEHYTERVG